MHHYVVTISSQKVLASLFYHLLFSVIRVYLFAVMVQNASAFIALRFPNGRTKDI